MPPAGVFIELCYAKFYRGDNESQIPSLRPAHRTEARRTLHNEAIFPGTEAGLRGPDNIIQRGSHSAANSLRRLHKTWPQLCHLDEHLQKRIKIDS
ncbi:hypothetical protein O3P69_016526 [Scylla paramamosain]|uniref:Uncharacterized protein n=1 Tax=Scylla paramamosain TaxID=85552 RepID=A0AAW0TGM8_SCYPA